MRTPVPTDHKDKILRVLRLSPAIYRDGHWPVAYDPVGGLQMQVWRITEQLSRLGVLQMVLTGHIPGEERRREPFPHTVVQSVGPALPSWMARHLGNLAWLLGLLPEVLFRAGHYDVVHVHFNHSIWCRVAVLIASMRGVPTIASRNTPLWGGLTNAFNKIGLPFAIADLIERFCVRGAKRVLVLTDHDLRQQADERKGHASRFTIVPDGIDPEQFEPLANEAQAVAQFRLKYEIPSDAYVVIYLGRISGEKGWKDLPLFLSLPVTRKVFLLVCGDGPDRNRLAAALRRVERPGNWCITGFLLPDDVRIALRASDVLVLPSRREAFGGVLLEAMASDLPAISYDVGGIGDVAGEPPAVHLVTAGQKDSLVEAFVDLLFNDTLRRELISRGRLRVQAFSVEKVAAAILAIYLSVRRPQD